MTNGLNGFSNNIGALLGKAENLDGKESPSLSMQPFEQSSAQNDLSLRNLALNFSATQQTGQSQDDKQPRQAYNVQIPLAENSHKASYEALSRRVMRTALELNGIKPTERELEEMMTTLSERPIDFAPKSDDPARYRATMATPKQLGTRADGKPRMGYGFTLTPQFQQTVINDYKRAQAALAGKPVEKAVVEMNLNERMSEAIKIAYEKGYIGKEVREQLGNLTPTELTIAFGLGGAASLAAKTGARAVIAPAGAVMLAMEMIKNGAEFEVFGKACARATTREQLDKPAQEFGKWMGRLSKEGALAAAGLAGARVAPAVMPKATAVAEQFLTTSIRGAKELMKQTGVIAEPLLVTPNGKAVPLSDIPNPKSPFGSNKGDNVFEARIKPEEVLTPVELQKLKDLAGYRETEGLPNYEYKKPTGTAAEIEVNGQKSQGVNTRMERNKLGVDSRAMREQTLQDIQTKLGKLKGVKYGDNAAKFLTHAEAQSLMTAAEKAGGKLPEKMMLTVDRTTCLDCRKGLPALLELYGVKELEIINASGRKWLVTPVKTIEITREK